MVADLAELFLQIAEPALHEAVLPGARFVACAELDLHALTQQLVPMAQILTALIAVQYGW